MPRRDPIKQATKIARTAARRAPLTFRPGGIEPELEKRTSPGEGQGSIAKRDLERYYEILAHSMPPLSEAEASLICDALNGVWLHEDAWLHIVHEVADAVRLNLLDEKWGADGGALVGRMTKWTAAQTLAVVDAVERFWREPETSTVASVGLVPWQEDLARRLLEPPQEGSRE